MAIELGKNFLHTHAWGIANADDEFRNNHVITDRCDWEKVVKFFKRHPNFVHDLVADEKTVTDHSEKEIDYLRIALGLSGMCVNNACADLVLSVMKEIEVKGSSFTVEDGARIECAIKEKYSTKKE